MANITLFHDFYQYLSQIFWSGGEGIKTKGCGFKPPLGKNVVLKLFLYASFFPKFVHSVL